MSTDAEVTNRMAADIGQTVQEKGFREDWELADKLEDMVDRVGAIIPGSDQELIERAASRLRINFLGMKLMLIVSESAEALETLRDVGAEGVLAGEGNFIEELADAEIRIKDLANMLNLDLGQAEVDKMEANKGRPQMHGRKV